MKNSSSIPKWQQYYHEQLDIQNKHQSFQAIFKNYNELFIKCQELQKQVQYYKTLQSNINKKNIHSQYTIINHSKIDELTRKLASVEAESNKKLIEYKNKDKEIIKLTTYQQKLEFENKELNNKVNSLLKSNNRLERMGDSDVNFHIILEKTNK